MMMFYDLRCAYELAKVQLSLAHSTEVTAGMPEKTKITRKRAIAKALQLEGHPDFAPVDLAYYQHFLFFLFENVAFWEVPPGNHKCRARGATPLVNVK